MMLEFWKQYIKNPRCIGAVAPSSKRLAKAMVQPIDFGSAFCIIEFGPGTGVFTQELINRRKEDTTLILIEQNVDFYGLLKKKYDAHKNLVIIHGSAENAYKILRKHGFSNADYIVSGLPFTSLPKEVSLRIIEAAKKVIGQEGLFITFQYTMIKRKFFEQHFKFKKCIHEIRNFPPAHVFVMELCG